VQSSSSVVCPLTPALRGGHLTLFCSKCFMPRHVDAPAGGCTKDEPTLLALRIRRIPDPKALEKVKSTLRYRDPDPAIAEVTFLDDGIGSFFFGDAQPLKNEEGPVPVSNRKLWMATS